MAESDAKAGTGTPEQEASGKKPRSSKVLLIAALVMSLVSMGGGFFLARIAFQQDASAFEPEYVEDGTEEGDKSGGEKDGDSKDADKKDADEKDGESKDGDKKDGDKKDGDKDTEKVEVPEIDTGLLEFKDFTTNIRSYDQQGVPSNSFLKVTVIMAYRTDPGAAELVLSRQPFIRDLFGGYLRGLSEADLRGMTGVMSLKAELLKRARAAMGSDLPQEILISDLIVQ